MQSKQNNINFISNGLLLGAAILFSAFSYSKKHEIRTELEKAKSTIIKYQTTKIDRAPKKNELKKIRQPQTKNKTKRSIDLKSQPTNKIKVSKNNPDSSSAVNTLPNPIHFDSTDVYTPIDIKPDVVNFPDQEATFKGGVSAMNKFIIYNLDINKMDLLEAKNILVHVEFVIDTKGQVTLINIKGEHHKSIEREIKRMILSMPNWIPGENKGRKVNTRMFLPIRIDLQ